MKRESTFYVILSSLMVFMFIWVIGCGGGSSTVTPTNPTTLPTNTPTERPTGTLSVQTDMPNRWAVLQAFETSAVNPQQEKFTDGSGNVSFTDVPLNTTCSVLIYEDETKGNILASKNISFDTSGQTETVNQGTTE